MRRRFVLGMTLIAALGALAPSRAEAVPIGTFSWLSDCGPDIGPCFTVENFSGDPLLSLPTLGLDGQSFTTILIQLTLTGPDDTRPLVPDTFSDPPGTLVPGGIAQTTEDLLGLSISLATISLDLALPGVLSLVDGETGVALTGLSAPDTVGTLDFAPAPAAVPEPGTLLLLLSGGLAIAALQRRRLHGRSRPE